MRAAAIYFKATRPTDPATDFYSGKVKYEAGKRVRPLPHDDEDRHICGPGLLHAADVPAMSLVGGEWPCRLFEVTGRPVAGFDRGRHAHKGGFRQLTVVREIDAHLALGPNGRSVARIIAQTHKFTHDETFQLRAAWDAAWDGARAAARAAAWDAARDAAWGAAWDAAWDGARAAARGAAWGAAWDAAGAAARDGARAAAWDAARGAAWGAAGDAARDAAGDAALALVVRDLISEDHFNLLYGPWASVFGDPE